ICSYKTVVDEVVDPDKEISLEEAKQIKSSYKLGSLVEQEETPKDFGRIAAQTAKQVVMQKLREAEKQVTLAEIAEKEDQLVTALVKRIEGTNVFVEIGSTEAVMGEKDQIPGEKYNIGDRVKVYVKRIPDDFQGSLVQVSRSHVNFVRRLFELEVPEIENGEVVINSIAREAGYRTKLAVSSQNPNLDTIGACVGNKGMRINNIVAELNGEKIDIVEYSDDTAVFVERALSPAQVLRVEILGEGEAMAVVPDDVLSLAIGKQGQNVRLAARLAHSKIDVKPQSKVEGVVSVKKPKAVHTDEFKFDENLSLDDMFKDEE
ncbi:MAG: transcription termination/antitermination protein NusA, partial [Clostridiales bacterium]|nr:transcription termination/antitermination protein NusA [Candidatus Apopatousia equi]